MNRIFYIQADTRQIQALIAAMHNLSPDKLDRVLVRAEDRTMRMAGTEIVRKMKEKSTIKHVTAIRKRVIPYDAPNAADGAALRISHTRINLIEFAAKQIKKRGGGVEYEVSPRAGRKTIRSAFITRGNYGTKGVFIRRPGRWEKITPKPARIGRAFPKLYRNIGGTDRMLAKNRELYKAVGNLIQRTPRYPIDMLRGPSLWQMFTGMENMVEEIITDSKQKLAKHVMDQVRLIVERRKGAAA